MATAQKESWQSGLGFVLAAAGSAVGLGNLWGFAYRASQGGGGAFVLLYVLIVLVTICLPVLVAEMVLGRSTGRSPLLAPVQAAGRNWQPLGWVFVVVSCGILAFYGVLMGWTGHTLLHAYWWDCPAAWMPPTLFFAGISGGSVRSPVRPSACCSPLWLLQPVCRRGSSVSPAWHCLCCLCCLIGLAIWASGLPVPPRAIDLLCCVGTARNF